MTNPEAASLPSVPTLSTGGRYVIFICAFLGWFCAGFNLAITSLAMEPAATHLLGKVGALDVARFLELKAAAPKPGKSAASVENWTAEKETELRHAKTLVARWFAWCQCAMLFGAASGGLLFGRLGDRIGRSKAMTFSILTFSVMAYAASFSQRPGQLVVLWYLASLGVGGMWPNGVALASEAWSTMSRPMISGVIGTSANIAIFLFGALASNKAFAITPDSWRWVMQVEAFAFVLGLFCLVAVPESPRWLAAQLAPAEKLPSQASMWEVFHPPFLGITLVGILLATIPLVGAWGSANWMIPWAQDPLLRANVQKYRALTGSIGSLLGGWIGSFVGRRRAYSLTSLAALCIAQYTFWQVVPSDRDFLIWVSALGFFSGIYFGWLPLFLPELFPTRVRSTGAGVSFNFGRILTAVTIFATGALMAYFQGDYARIGRVTSLVFAIGIFAVWLAPDTTQKQLQD